jgi:alpha-glucoside transport system permease protein
MSIGTAPAAGQDTGKATGTGPDRPEAERPSLASRLAHAVSQGPTYTILLVVSVLWLVPSFGLLVSSFRTAATNSQQGWWTVFTNPGQLTLEPYRNVLSSDALVRSFFNTFYITIPATIAVVIVASMAAYAFTFVQWRGRDVSFLVVVGMLVVPLQIGLIPIANLYGGIGLFGTITGVVIYHVAFGLPFAIFLMRNFFIGIPGELLEAARLDGATEMRLFFRVVLPLGIPAVASLLIFQFLWTWNDLLIALVFAGPRAAPITVAIQQQTRQFGSNIDIIAPAAFLSVVVPLVVFFAFQRFFAQGLLAGSGK